MLSQITVYYDLDGLHTFEKRLCLKNACNGNFSVDLRHFASSHTFMAMTFIFLLSGLLHSLLVHIAQQPIIFL